MSVSDGDDCVFPIIANDNDDVVYHGLCLRDYFAAEAMSGILSGVNARLPSGANEKMVAKDAYKIADAMLAARGK
jgi:hypothetical protein